MPNIRNTPRKTWLFVGGISFVVFIVAVLTFVGLYLYQSLMVSAGNGSGSDTTQNAGLGAMIGAAVAAVASGITSITSVIGLILGYKKSKSETLKADLEVQKLQLDLERTNLEMAKLRSAGKRKK